MIIIHSDDYGYKDYTDKKIVQLMAKGKLKSVSVIANMVESKSLAKMLKIARKKGDVKIGLHINLTEGHSLSDKSFIPSLVFKKNRLLGLMKFFLKLIMKQINEEHIEKEINRQIDYLNENGVKVSILDSHEHIHALSPVAEIIEQIAIKRGIERIRSYKNVKNHTLIANIKYQILKITSYLSHLVYFGSIDLPATWKIKTPEDYSYMSWEGNNFDPNKVKEKALILVTHPFLPFDSNKSYMWFLI